MGLTTRVGSVTLTSRLPEVQAAIQRESQIRVREMAYVVHRETKNVLSGARHGRFYRIPGTKRPRAKGAARRIRATWTPASGYAKGGDGAQIGAASLLGTRGRRGFYRASAAGEAPARRLGKLSQSVKVRTKTNRETATAWVGSGHDYAVYLEKGTKQMKPRPFLSVAFDNMRSKLRSVATREFPV